MKSIRIKNLKSIQDSGEIEIKPITVFVGKNSSGKSSLIRCFPLFKQSAESKILGTILWSGKYVDYGSFEESINYKEKSGSLREISFSFVFYTSLSSDYHRQAPNSKTEIRLTINVSGDEYSKSSYTDVIFEINGNKFSLKTSPELKILSTRINETDFTKQANEIYRAYKTYSIIPILFGNTKGMLQQDSNYAILRKELKKYVHHRTSDERILQIAKNLRFGDDEFIKKSLSNKSLVGDYAASKISQWPIDDIRLKTIKNQIILLNMEILIDSISDNFRAQFISSRYITPLRAAADRYYRIQNTSIEELDPNGSNLAMFLYAKSDNEIAEINKWLLEEIGFSIEISGSHGHASIFVIDDKDKNKTNIADTGFGISQVLPVLIQIWQQSKKSHNFFRSTKSPTIIAIEQPELHLHPKMQSRIGEAFCKAIKLAKDKGIDLRIIIETHSKEIIDAIGRSIEQKIITKDDANIYIINKNMEPNVMKSNFDEGGYLEAWPYGFFDGT